MDIKWNVNDVLFSSYDSIERIQKEFNYVKKFVESYDDLNDFEKYELLTHFLYLRYNSQDILNLVNIKENHNYTRLVDIPTKMEYEVEHLEDDWSTWTNINRAIYTCATHDTFELEETIYSYEELQNLIKHFVVSPIAVYNMSINDYTKDKEKYQHISTFISVWNDGYINVDVDEYGDWRNRLIIKPKEQGIPIMIKYLEKAISHEELFGYIKKSFKELLDRLKYFGYYTKEEIDTYNELMDYYNKNFKNKRRLVKVKK